MSILSKISGPADVKKLKSRELKLLAQEIREAITKVVNKNGGHLASNLGVVELTIALHRVFDCPKDKIVFDVSHQTYTHKLLTGRNDEKFLKLRATGGYSGFSAPEESECDAFIAGHAGTALSVALGFAYARNSLTPRSNACIVAVLGDGSLSCGMVTEALNNLKSVAGQLTVIINDNNFSISENTGTIPIYLNQILRSSFYKSITQLIKKCLGNGKFGKCAIRYVRKLKRAIKSILLPTSFFEYYGLRYLGPFDGHNIEQLEEVLDFCKRSENPILLHVKTTKGKGCDEASANPEMFHNVNSASASEVPASYAEILGRELVKIARQDKKIVGVTAAMAQGTGLDWLQREVPSQYIDVGISESHAVTFSAALAKAGMRPVCAIYSTFLQRSFDQIIHDVCIQNLPVIFCVGRAGISPNDGATHNGMFDVSFLRLIPNIVVAQPEDAQEFVNLLHSALRWHCPVFIRYPKICQKILDASAIEFKNFIHLGRSRELVAGEDVCILALGNMSELASTAAAELKNSKIYPTVINAIFAKPLDEAMLEKLSNKHKLIVTIEDNTLVGGFGSAVLEFCSRRKLDIKVLRFGWEDKFLRHASSQEELRMESGLCAQNIVNEIVKILHFQE